MTALKRRFKQKITIKGGKGQTAQKKAEELEAQRATMEEKEKQFQVQVVDFEGHITSLADTLKDTSKHQTNIQPVQEHVLSQRRRMHQLQKSIEEERCKILQVDSRLE